VPVPALTGLTLPASPAATSTATPPPPPSGSPIYLPSLLRSATAARSASPALFTDAHKIYRSRNTQPARLFRWAIIGLGKIEYLITQKASTAFGMKILYSDIVRMGAAIE